MTPTTKLTKPAFIACDDLRQIQVLTRQGDDELRQVVPRHVVANRWRQELHLINLPRSKMSAHVAKGIRFAAKMPPLLGDAPRASHSRGTFPTACYRYFCSISLWSCFPSGNLAEERLHVVAYSQGRPTQRRPATRKRMVERLYLLEREGSKPYQALTTPIKRLRKQNGQNREPERNDPHPKAGSAVTRRLPLNS